MAIDKNLDAQVGRQVRSFGERRKTTSLTSETIPQFTEVTAHGASIPTETRRMKSHVIIDRNKTKVSYGDPVEFADRAMRAHGGRKGLGLKAILTIFGALGAGVAFFVTTKGTEIAALSLGASKMTALLASIGAIIPGVGLGFLGFLAAWGLALGLMLAMRKGSRMLRRTF